MNEGMDEFEVELGSRRIRNRRRRGQKEGKQVERRFIQLGMSTQVFDGSDERRRKRYDRFAQNRNQGCTRANTPFQEV
jgi:hypothetical protein